MVVWKISPICCRTHVICPSALLGISELFVAYELNEQFKCYTQSFKAFL